MTRIFLFVLAAPLFSLHVLGQKAQLPDGAGKDVLQRVCGACHAPEVVIGKSNTHDGWTQVVGEMITRGAQGSDDDFETVVNYLTANFPPKADLKKVNVNKAEAAELQSALQLPVKDSTAIVEYRKQNGDFKTLADLKKVPGVDADKLDSVKALLVF